MKCNQTGGSVILSKQTPQHTKNLALNTDDVHYMTTQNERIKNASGLFGRSIDDRTKKRNDLKSTRREQARTRKRTTRLGAVVASSDVKQTKKKKKNKQLHENSTNNETAAPTVQLELKQEGKCDRSAKCDSAFLRRRRRRRRQAVGEGRYSSTIQRLDNNSIASRRKKTPLHFVFALA